MKTQHLFIQTIPAVLYGENAERGYLFLHGQMGHKEEAESFAQLVCPKGYQVLSIDLPAHGERQNREEELTPWLAVPDIQAAKDWAMQRWNSYSVRATSIGAYFAMLALEDPDRALLLSPIVDMEDLILTMLGWAGTTEPELENRGEISTTFGQTLSWKYLCWVRAHAIHQWTCRTSILYGSEDNMTPRRKMESFAQAHHAVLTVLEGGEHWFHTPEQLAALKHWEQSSC